MQKAITLLSCFQATVQDYNTLHDTPAAGEKGKMENCAILRKGLGISRGLWVLLQKYYQQVVKTLEAPEGFFPALGPASCPTGHVPPDMKRGGKMRGSH